MKEKQAKTYFGIYPCSSFSTALDYAYLVNFVGQDVISSFACGLIQGVLIFLFVYNNINNINIAVADISGYQHKSSPMNNKKEVGIVMSCLSSQGVGVLNFE